MTKEELVEFLKENLTVELTTKSDYSYGGVDRFLSVKLKIDDEVISSDRTILPL